MEKIPRDVIIQELNELKKHFGCSAYDDFSRSTAIDIIADHWQERLPYISPKAFYASLEALQLDKGKPDIWVVFTKDSRPGYSGFDVRMDYKQWRKNNPRDMPEYRERNIELKFRDKITISNTFLPPHCQEQGGARKILHWCVQQAETFGIKNLRLTATGLNGGYTWARMRFVPDMVKNIRGTSSWGRLKTQLTELRLNADHTRIIWPSPPQKDQQAMEKEATERRRGPYANIKPDGFELLPEETDLINKILESKDSSDLWLFSDMGRELMRINRGPDKPQHIVTVGKALLCGLSWMGSRDLTPGSPGLDEFTGYLTAIPQRTSELRGR